jgi:hypothetical protein
VHQDQLGSSFKTETVSFFVEIFRYKIMKEKNEITNKEKKGTKRKKKILRRKKYTRRRKLAKCTY